jgi:hypothetical protein
LRSPARRTASIAGLLSFALALPACDDRQHHEPAIDRVSEVGFSEQAEAVRDGRSDQIRIEHTSVRDDQLAELDGLEGTLRRINISQSKITDAGLARIAGMRSLNQLRLGSEKVSDDGLACLAQLRELRHLHLIDMPISDAGLAHLHELKSLESLYLDGTRATDDEMKRLIEALPGVHIHFDGGHHRVDSQADDHGP